MRRRPLRWLSTGTLRATYRKLAELGIGAPLRDEIEVELMLRFAEAENIIHKGGTS